ncbi:MAG TPA: iron-containing redox enzyme family protein [Candidatus Nitrosocosmicus sp.]|nr:iron-containing redox enzyme family protein [Candidatus Nitrosocosmicus sp.]
MTLLIDQINNEIEKHSLLKHRFYQLWQEGKLTLDQLAGYSKEYYQLVKIIPLIVENTLRNNSNPRYEKLIQEALQEENEHIEPWVKFASSLSVNSVDLKNYSPDELTTQALKSLLEISNASFIEGAASMYAFEKELPKISETKSAGLREFYGIHNEPSHEYFDIHREVDVYHARMWENILNDCSEEMHEKVLNAARISLKAQNDLLDAVQEKYVDKIKQ